ncbi:MAG: phosphopentomutase [Acidobacteriota bacterium]
MGFERIVLIVLDSVGIGEMPDAETFGDAGSDTLGHLCAYRRLAIPNLERLGLGRIKPLEGIAAVSDPLACFGKMALASNGKDTTSGHWELAGVYLSRAFPTYPNGFPPEVISRFEEAIGRKTLGNVVASGTEIIKQLGQRHLETGFPIVYTSADSVFQIAAHEEIIPVPELYAMCRAARSLLVGKHQVGRVIARPFVGKDSSDFVRTARRLDFAIEPPKGMLLDRLHEAAVDCVCVGKVASVFCERGVTRSLKTSGNQEGMAKTCQVLQDSFRGLVFVNLVDFDMLYGHRNDREGYARALEALDAWLPSFQESLGKRDLCIMTADHGCDPTTPSTDHSREYVPLLVFGPGCRKGVDLGTRTTLADAGQTIAENFATKLNFGKSFLKEIAL